MIFRLILLGLALANPSLVFPAPYFYSSGNETVVLLQNVKVKMNIDNARLRKAWERQYNKTILQRWRPIVPIFRDRIIDMSRTIRKIHIKVMSQDEALKETTDESYEMSISIIKYSAKLTITAQTIYGAMHGIETFAQMVQYDTEKQTHLISRAPFTIRDQPQFSHRGLLLDTSRNYYPVEDIKRTIRALAMNKMNVFHWHIVDSHSWPFQSSKHPKLSELGSYEDQIYAMDQIKDVVEYGLDFGVRVIPELEAPAHSYAMGKAYPEMATCMDCDDWNINAAEPPSGQIDPTNPLSIKVVNDLIDEFSTVFSDDYIHLSGDEVNLACWNNSKTIRKYVENNNVKLDGLLNKFAAKMHSKTLNNNKKIMVWQEMVLNHNVSLPKDSLVQVWLGAKDAVKVIEKGYRVVASSYQYWYLDCGHGAWVGGSPSGGSWCDPFKHWQIIYSYNLLANLTESQSSRVAGGEVAIWSEQVDPVNLDQVAWPRTSAAAEVLWSGNYHKNSTFKGTQSVLPRLNNFRFRMVNHNINAEPLQPLWCVQNPGRCDSRISESSLPYTPDFTLV